MVKKDASRAKKIIVARQFEDWYERLQENIPEVSLDPTSENGYLVRGDSNNAAPIHRWYSLKESYSAELPKWVISHIKTKYKIHPQKILDPFIGGGTTGVSLGQNGLTVYGIEYNPFIRFVAKTKASASRIEKNEFEKAIKKLAQIDFATEDVEIPEMSTLLNRDYVSKKNLKILLGSQKAIKRLHAPVEVKELLRLGVAASIESAFNLRKDGRALRYSPDRAVANVSKIISQKQAQILADLEILQSENKIDQHNIFEVLAGSAVHLDNLLCNDQKISLSDNQFDVVVYSPPYLNNFDYSEVYKLELWLMGFVKDYDEWKNLRLGTLRSHPSVKFSETSALANDALTMPIYNKLLEMGKSTCVPDNRKSELTRTILGYFDDMYSALKEQYRVLKKGGVLCFVVANSRHYFLPIATDIILAEIARCIGFESLELITLRKRNGRTRQKAFLRESAVFLKKP